MSDALARAIFFDRGQLLRPLAEIDRLIQQRKRLRPAQRRLLRERAAAAVGRVERVERRPRARLTPVRLLRERAKSP